MQKNRETFYLALTEARRGPSGSKCSKLMQSQAIIGHFCSGEPVQSLHGSIVFCDNLAKFFLLLVVIYQSQKQIYQRVLI